jgi:hypothetical protein
VSVTSRKKRFEGTYMSAYSPSERHQCHIPVRFKPIIGFRGEIAF